MMAHVIGYTGEISEAGARFAGVRQFRTRRGDRQIRHRAPVQRHAHGQSTASARWWWIIAARCAQELKNKPAVPGKDLQLTIDLDLQAVAELAMDGRNGAVVALDPRTGEVLAMVSRPDLRPQQIRRSASSPRTGKRSADNPDNPCSTAPSRRSRRPARPSSPSWRWRRWKPGPSTRSLRCIAPAAPPFTAITTTAI